MADWGAFIKSQDGTLLVTPDTPCYELVGEYWPTSRSGNVNTYTINSGTYPLIFVRCGLNQSAGVLAIQTISNGYRIEVLSTADCPIQVFRIIEGTESGYGMATYSTSGQLVFASSRNVLNVRNAGNISEGASFSSSPGVDMVSYTCGPVRPSSSIADRWVFVTAYGGFEQQWVCRFGYYCEDSFSCGFDMFGNYTCGWQPVCTWQTRCGFESVTVTWYIYARVRRTSWTIERGTARINSSNITFSWVLHLSGYYDEVLYYQEDKVSTPSIGGGAVLGSGYSPPTTWTTQNVRFEGQLTKDNRYPYTTSRANEISLTCLTSVRSNYD
jgi:hypothetical protein